MLDTLKPEFKSLVERTLKDCRALGVTMVPYYALRSPADQAKLWRQSRSAAEVRAAISQLKRDGAQYLAMTLDSVGPCHGKWATNALPGQSWHQYGEALDCFWELKGVSCWDTSDDPMNGYQVYAKMASKNGLTSLGHSMGDWVHIQLQPFPKPHYDWIRADQLMQEEWG